MRWNPPSSGPPHVLIKNGRDARSLIDNFEISGAGNQQDSDPPSDDPHLEARDMACSELGCSFGAASRLSPPWPRRRCKPSESRIRETARARATFVRAAPRRRCRGKPRAGFGYKLFSISCRRQNHNPGRVIGTVHKTAPVSAFLSRLHPPSHLAQLQWSSTSPLPSSMAGHAVSQQGPALESSTRQNRIRDE